MAALQVKKRKPVKKGPKGLEHDKRVHEAALDPNILTRPVQDTMRMFDISHSGLVRARRLCRARILTEQGSAALDAIYARKEIERLRSILTNAKTNHPGILFRLVKFDNGAAIGKRYGLTRERIRQYRDTLEKYARMTGKSSYESVREDFGDEEKSA